MANPFLPDMPIFSAESEKLRREKRKAVIVKQADLYSGNVEYNLQKAQNFSDYGQRSATIDTSPEPLNMREAMTSVGTQLQDQSVDKDEAWWQKALGVLEPLKYLDVPAELLMEVVEGVIPGKWGAEGKAPREDFEAWSAMFGQDQGSFKERWDKASGAFEKRPLWAQLALGGLQIAATGGAGLLAKGILTGAKGASAASRISAAGVRAGGYVIDPAELAFKAIGKGVKSGGKAAIMTVKSINRFGVDPKVQRAGVQRQYYFDSEGNRILVPEVPKELQDELATSKGYYVVQKKDPNTGEMVDHYVRFDDAQAGDAAFSYNSDNMANPRFGNAFLRMVGDEVEKVDELPDAFRSIVSNADTIWGAGGQISPILRRGNEFRRLFGDLWKKGNDATNLYEKGLYYKELSQMQLQLSMASRPGVIENLTKRQIREFLDTELLTVAEGAKGVQKGDRTGLLKSLDNGEAWIAVNKYMNTLEELGIDMGMDDAIFGLRFGDDTATKMALTSKNKTNTISILRKYIGQNYELTPDAANIRNQRASEMWLEGYTFDDIQGQLGHAGESPRLVYTYIQDIDNFIGNDTRQLQSKALERLRATGKISMNFAPEVKNAILEGRISLEETLKEARKNKVWGQRKSKYAGKAEEAKTILEIGEAYLRSDELLDFMNPVQVTKFDSIIADTALDNTTKKIMLEHIRLEALSDLAYEMRLGHTDITRKMEGITGGGSISQQGKLERAGYKVTTKNGRLQIVSVAKGVNREKFAQVSALDTVLGRYEGGKWISNTGAWDEWANGLVNEYNKLQGFLDEYASVKSIDGLVTKYNKDWSITDVLAEYIDTKAIGNYNSWMTLSDDAQSMFDSWGNDILKMRMIGSGRVALSEVSDKNAFFKVRNKYRKSLNAVYNDLDPKFKVEDGAKAFGELDNSIPVELATKVRRIHQWTQQEGVAESFKAFHVYEGMAGKELADKLVAMAKNNGDLFGSNWKRTYTEIPKGKKQPVITTEGHAMLTEIADILANNNLLTNFKKANSSKILDFEEYTAGAAELRPDLFGTADMLKAVEEEELFHGISPKLLAANRKSIDMVVEDMGGWDWARQWNEYNSGPKKHFMDIARPLFAIFAGGQGQMARGVTKPISAAGHLYRTHERDAIQIARTVKELTSKVLDIKTDVASDELRKIGIRDGNQWFDGLTIKPRSEIEAFEARLEVREAYKRTGKKGTADVLPTWRKVIGVTRNAPPGTKFTAGAMADPDNMLRQVDVVLERIPPQYWDNYFELSDEQRRGLLWIKSLQSEIDKTATARGVDIIGAIEDKGGQYLTNYLPRLYRNAKNRVKLGQRKSPIKLLNNYNTHFQKRVNPDILDNLSIDANLVNMEDALNRSVLESLDQRLGMYYEVMAKEGTNVEARKVLQELTSESAAFKSEFSHQLNELDNLERIFNDRIGGIAVGDSGRLGKLAKSRQALNGDGTNKIDNPLYQHSWLAEDGAGTIGRARANADTIRKSIQDRRMALKGQWDDVGMGTEVQANMWLDDTFRRMTKRDQIAVRQYLQATPPVLLKPVQKVAELIEGMNQMARTLKSGFDLGAPMIHGYNSLVKLPWFIDGKFSDDGRKAWGIATNNMRKAFLNKDYLDEYMIQNHHLREQASPWIMLGEAEPLQALTSDYGPMKILRENAAKFLDPIPGGDKFRVAQRFEQSFVMFTDSLRMELWKSLEPSVTRTLSQTADAAGKMLDPTDISNVAVRKAYTELGAVINKMTGVFDQDLAGMTPLQRLLESSLVFFAPMYRRATYGIIADLARGGIRQREAIRQLSGVVAAGAGIAFLLEATGNNDRAFAMDEDGNPDLTYRFGKVMYGGYMTGIGGAWNSAFRLVSDLTMKAQDNDNPIDDGWYQNPYLDIIGRKGRSQFAPSMGLITDLVSGRTYNGDPLRDDSDPLWGETIKHVSRQTLPFWLDISAEGGSGWLPAMGSEFLGLSSFRISEFDKMAQAREYATRNWERPELVEWRNKQLSTGGSVNWVALPVNLKQLIQDEDPTTRVALQSYEEIFGPVAQGESGLFRKYREKRSQHDLKLVQTLSDASYDFERGAIDGKKFGEQKAKAYYARRQFNEALLAPGSEYHELQEWFNTLRMAKSDEDRAFQGDILYDMWMTDVVHHPDNIDPETGDYSWDLANRREADFIREHGMTASDLEYIKDRRQYWIRQLPLVAEYESAMKDLSPYFNIHDIIWKPGSEMNAIASKFFEKTPEIRNRLKEQYSIYKKIDRARSEAREKLRRQRPDIDWLLVRWYGNTAKHMRNEYQRRQLAMQQDRKLSAETRGEWQWSTPSSSRFNISPSGRINTGI